MRQSLLALIILALAGCSSATKFQMQRPDGTLITATSAKQQSEEQAKWVIKIGADGSVALDFGTKGTQPVNMTAETLSTILDRVVPGK
jgi:uncharacterized protein YceK